MTQRRSSFPLYLILMIFCGLALSGCSRAKDARSYIFHDVYVGAEFLIDSHKNSTACEDIFLNADGSLTLTLTEAQRKQWADPRQIEHMLVLMKQLGVDVVYSDDYTKMHISAPDGVANAATPMLSNFAWFAELYQILNGSESWSLEVTVINCDTGETIQQLHLPEDALDWSFLAS